MRRILFRNGIQIMKQLISWIVYIPSQIIFLPIGILGAILIAYRQMLVSKRLAVSQTAIEVFNARWTLDIFGLRKDPGAAKIGPFLPNTSTLGLWLTLFPLWLKSKISGRWGIYPRCVKPGFENPMDMFTSRTFYFDNILARHLPTVEQFVLMGAGMDTRPYGALDIEQVKIFELDRSHTQQLKRDSLYKAGMNVDHVTFVPVDFVRDDLFERLTANHYDPNKKTIFLWEGVTLYLSEATVRDTLARVHANSCEGSVLLTDVYSDRLIDLMRSRTGQKLLQYTHEGAHFSLNFGKEWENELDLFVGSTGFSLGATFFLGSHSQKGPFMAVAELVV